MSNLVKNEKGQAIFEFVVFLPFMLMTYFLMISISNSINGSINQQKALRGFFYTLISNDSYIPRKLTISRLQGVGTAGMEMVGWKRELNENDEPVAACWELKTPFAPSVGDECEDKEVDGNSTQHIKVKTVYGVCGTTYIVVNNSTFTQSSIRGLFSSCTLAENPIGPLPLR